jgi:uncharacterized OB-fold protein
LTGSADELAAPRPSAETSFYWEALSEHKLRLQGCGECGRLRFPPMPSCPYCASGTTLLRELSGRGSVYSFVVVRAPFSPAFAPEVPYAVALVELEEGSRLPARLEDFEAAAIDSPVEAEFVDHDGWTELRFRPVSSAVRTGDSTRTRAKGSEDGTD